MLIFNVNKCLNGIIQQMSEMNHQQFMTGIMGAACYIERDPDLHLTEERK